MSTIHSTSIVEDGAVIGENVTIDAYSIIRSSVVLGNGTTVGSFCDLGVGSNGQLHIGNNSIIRSHSVLYSGSSFGDMLQTGHRVTIREGTFAGRSLRVGTLSDVQGDVSIGDYVRMHSNVHIGKYTQIGSFVWLFPYVVTTNDPHPPSDVQQGVILEDFSVIATMSVLLPGVRVASHSIVGAHSRLTKDTESGYLYSGNPAKRVCESSKVRLKDGTRRPAYPWTSHFKRGYPSEVTCTWQ